MLALPAYMIKKYEANIHSLISREHALKNTVVIYLLLVINLHINLIKCLINQYLYHWMINMEHSKENEMRKIVIILLLLNNYNTDKKEIILITIMIMVIE